MMDDKSITREDALNAINRIWDRCEEIEAHLPEGDPDKTGYKMIADYLAVWKYLNAQPEIVHCEFCKHWKNNHLCECLSRYGTFETPKDFFCGYGKAK
ncbi:MAG: hypothetical protein J6I53_10815 [Treponema sp.]|nr:hypothetical protein [Treponema sp.]